jgi:hypothetical protein
MVRRFTMWWNARVYNDLPIFYSTSAGAYLLLALVIETIMI